MGGILSYFFPDAGLDTTEQVQDDNIAEEVSVAVIGAIEVSDLVRMILSCAGK